MTELVEKFQYKETLSSDASSKSVVLLGEIDGQDAIVSLSKTQFDLEDPEFFKTLGVKEIRNLESNDIYSWNMATVVQDLVKSPQIKVNVIFPATDTLINKHRVQQMRVVVETPEMYQNIVLPYIGSMKGSPLNWVYNILDHGAEADRVVYRDNDYENGFVLLPDMKWDRVTLSTLYMVAIVLRKDLSSVRDLNYTHIPLLQHIKTESLKAVTEKYAVDTNQIKLYFHYQPSYYHLHIHVAHIAQNQQDFGRSLLLDNVIEQLKYMGEKGLKDATLTYFIKESHDLWKSGLSNS